ncbi:ATP-binding cassette domain-containing protein [Psychrilyobacter piezotolerans]|uniref:ATP-binding cassette domain-containing protein n=2 Tax=Fusobacteriaceae TaxID=203492 RepID=A0ABX9KIW5_9FUSO|nr:MULTISPECIES: ABC transporter ATP-binding protein [Psychrilyobacter]MCS5421201.1 ABC transporter ATP-binding protein/permease [Psychrilyobacter sp. S5]RDE62685.1 ABC transporter ATP-binding protein [Psychrilyobacter sp. S5]REI41615.1 ATP-binding cassette domain-containing protein [Psychrilyobacter piezotolerans]
MKLKVQKTSLKKMFDYGMHYKYRFMVIVILSLIVGLGKAAPAYLSKYLMDNVLIAKDTKMLLLVSGGLVISAVIKGFSMYYKETFSSYTTRLVVRDIQQDIYRHLHKLSHSYFDKTPQGEIMARISGDADNLGKIGFMVFQILPEFLTVTVLLIGLFRIDVILALMTLVLLPAMMMILKKILKKIKKTARKRQDQRGELNSLIQESLSGIRVVKAFATEQDEIKKYEEKNMEVLNTEYRNKKVEARISPINEVVTTTIVVGVLLYGGNKVIIDANFTAGDLTSFLTSLGLMFEPLKKVIKRGSELMSIIPSADRVMELLEEVPEVVEKKDAADYGDLSPKVKFKDLKFRYGKDLDYAIDNINFEANAGEVVALVGRSGSGKTTLVNLIPRFYEVEEGSITIDGMDIRDLKIKELRDHIGIVPQETFLFSGSIYSNILYGAGRDVTKEDVINAAKMANAHNFIIEFENGYDQEVGERGTLLSGGQKQRIAIARALLKNPEIMILDEATSALDTESERLVQDALEKLMVGRTTFVIAHRLSTIVNADKIVVMDKGKIAEAGSHEELLSHGGIYKKLYETQFGEE